MHVPHPKIESRLLSENAIGLAQGRDSENVAHMYIHIRHILAHYIHTNFAKQYIYISVVGDDSGSGWKVPKDY